MSNDYKKCQNGHYYTGDGPCPYCNGRVYTTGYVEPPTPSEIDDPNLMKFGLSPSLDNKVCPNHHD